MSTPDWKKLAPQEPAPTGSYVTRPESVAVRVRRRLEQGTSPIAIVGPTGAGKSSELASLSMQVSDGRPAALCFQDAFPSLRPAPYTGQELVGFAASLLMLAARRAPAGLGDGFRQRWGVPVKGASFGDGDLSLTKPVDAMRELIAELRSRGDLRRPFVFVDGLERREDDAVRSTLEAFRPFLPALDLVVVLPARWDGDGAFAAVLEGYRIEALRPVPVRSDHGPGWREGRAFLAQIVCKRLGVDAPPDARAAEVLDRAAEASGGIPRVFLQLVQDAAFYGSVAKRAWPDGDDLRQAMRDQVSSLRRLLRPGDLAALQAARGTDGLEVDVDRRVRFLGHGLLLEYGDAEDTRVFPSPLLEGLLALRSAA